MFSTSVPNTAIYQCEHAVTQRIHERTVDMDVERKKEKDGNPLFVGLHSRVVGLIVPGISLAQNFEEILGWLDGLNCAEKQDVTLLLRQPDTCKWLFDTTQYKMWRDGESSCLWLCGKRKRHEISINSSLLTSSRSQPGLVNPYWRMLTLVIFQ